MGFLGLSEPIENEDNLFQRLFWPSDRPGEADALGQQGFWICAIVAILSFLFLVVQAHPIIALITLVFFGLGGIGVREHSTAAAILVATAYLLNQIVALISGVFPGVLTIIAAGLLLANIRGTRIAARWEKAEDAPEPLRHTFIERTSASVWPKARIPFFCVAGIYMLLLALGTFVALQHTKPMTGTQQIYLTPAK